MITSKHPQYTPNREQEWQMTRDCLAGELAVKAADTQYLPRPNGFKADTVGNSLWASYKLRAQFPEMLAPTVSAMMGIAHAKEVQIEMPDALAYLWENADGEGTPLEELHRSITRELLTVGRIGVLADVPEGSSEPVLLTYSAETIINWDRGFAVLDETGPVRKDFEWETVKRYRVLSIEDGAYTSTEHDGDGNAVSQVVPSALGGKRLDEVPLVVANSLRVSFDIAPPPLIGVSRAAIAIYQLSADYRWQLFNTGVETLVVINGDAPEAVGPAAVHVMQGSEGNAPDMKYVGPSCKGIEANKIAIEDNRTAAVMAGAKLLEQSDAVQESGNARELRFKSETATLQTIVQSSCKALERALRFVAIFKGLNPADVVVTAPKELMDASMTATDAATLFGLVERSGLSWESYYQAIQRGGLVSDERTADDEMALIRSEGME